MFNTDDIAEHDHAFDNTLRANGYPRNVILETKRPRKRRHLPQQQQDSNKDWLYFKIPFISDGLDRKITKIFRKENIDVRLTHKAYTLRNALSTKRDKPECKRTNCPVAHTKFCLRRNTIYKITCDQCQQFYVGSTTRHTHDRVR